MFTNTITEPSGKSRQKVRDNMKKEIEKIELVKEGQYHTLYINGENLGCGYFQDMVDDLEYYINSYISGEYKDVR